MQRTILSRSIFNWLREKHQFLVDKSDGRYSIVGQYEGFYIRLYYDPKSLYHKRVDFGDIVFIVFYKHDSISPLKLEKLNTEHRLYDTIRYFYQNGVETRINKLPFLLKSDVVAQLDRTISILEKEKIQPITSDQLKETEENFNKENYHPQPLKL